MVQRINKSKPLHVNKRALLSGRELRYLCSRNPLGYQKHGLYEETVEYYSETAYQVYDENSKKIPDVYYVNGKIYDKNNQEVFFSQDKLTFKNKFSKKYETTQYSYYVPDLDLEMDYENLLASVYQLIKIREQYPDKEIRIKPHGSRRVTMLLLAYQAIYNNPEDAHSLVFKTSDREFKIGQSLEGLNKEEVNRIKNAVALHQNLQKDLKNAEKEFTIDNHIDEFNDYINNRESYKDKEVPSGTTLYSTLEFKNWLLSQYAFQGLVSRINNKISKKEYKDAVQQLLDKIVFAKDDSWLQEFDDWVSRFNNWVGEFERKKEINKIKDHKYWKKIGTVGGKGIRLSIEHLKAACKKYQDPKFEKIARENYQDPKSKKIFYKDCPPDVRQMIDAGNVEALENAYKNCYFLIPEKNELYHVTNNGKFQSCQLAEHERRDILKNINEIQSLSSKELDIYINNLTARNKLFINQNYHDYDIENIDPQKNTIQEKDQESVRPSRQNKIQIPSHQIHILSEREWDVFESKHDQIIHSSSEEILIYLKKYRNSYVLYKDELYFVHPSGLVLKTLACDLNLLDLGQKILPPTIINEITKRAQENNSPYLVKKGDRFSIYGNSNGKWQFTELYPPPQKPSVPEAHHFDNKIKYQEALSEYQEKKTEYNRALVTQADGIVKLKALFENREKRNIQFKKGESILIPFDTMKELSKCHDLWQFKELSKKLTSLTDSHQPRDVIELPDKEIINILNGGDLSPDTIRNIKNKRLKTSQIENSLYKVADGLSSKLLNADWKYENPDIMLFSLDVDFEDPAAQSPNFDFSNRISERFHAEFKQAKRNHAPVLIYVSDEKNKDLNQIYCFSDPSGSGNWSITKITGSKKNKQFIEFENYKGLQVGEYSDKGRKGKSFTQYNVLTPEDSRYAALKKVISTNRFHKYHPKRVLHKMQGQEDHSVPTPVKAMLQKLASVKKHNSVNSIEQTLKEIAALALHETTQLNKNREGERSFYAGLSRLIDFEATMHNIRRTVKQTKFKVFLSYNNEDPDKPKPRTVSEIEELCDPDNEYHKKGDDISIRLRKVLEISKQKAEEISLFKFFRDSKTQDFYENMTDLLVLKQGVELENVFDSLALHSEFITMDQKNNFSPKDVKQPSERIFGHAIGDRIQRGSNNKNDHIERNKVTAIDEEIANEKKKIAQAQNIIKESENRIKKLEAQKELAQNTGSAKKIGLANYSLLSQKLPHENPISSSTGIQAKNYKK